MHAVEHAFAGHFDDRIGGRVDDIGVAAGTAGQAVGTRAAIERIVAAFAEQRVGAVFTEQRVGAAAAFEPVVAGVAEQPVVAVVADEQVVVPKVALVEEAFAGQFLHAGEELPDVETVIVLEGAQGEKTMAWADVEATESDVDVDAAWRAVEAEDLITLIYTSGTTGPPKGVQLVHRNLMAAVQGVEALIRFPDGSKVISWLPSAHIAERMAHHYLPIVYAMTITCCPNPREVVAVPAFGQADLVLRRAEDLGEAQGRHGGVPGLGRGRRAEARVARRSHAQGRARAGRRAGARRPSRDGRGGRPAAVLRHPRDARLRRGRRGERRRRADPA